LVSRVKVNMRVCGKETMIEVKAIGDDEYEVTAETDCPNVRQLIDMLPILNIIDLTDKPNSRIWDCFKEARMSSNCLTPAAVLNAAWIEAGLLSKNLAKKNGYVSIEYLD